MLHVFDTCMDTTELFPCKFSTQVPHTTLQHRQPFPPMTLTVLVLIPIIEEMENDVDTSQPVNYRIHILDY